MNTTSRNFLIAVVLSTAGFGAQAQTTSAAPAGAPAGSTVLCKDGSYASPATRSGACRGHHGIQTWYGPSAAAQGGTQSAAPVGAAAAAGGAAAAAPMTRPAPNSPAAAVPAPAASAPVTTAPPKTGAAHPPLASMPVAPGGGAGKVWVNESSKVYHCADDRYYGKTHNGAYMTEADAKAAGAHAAHNKSCS